MPIESNTALEPIPRPGNGGHVRLVRKLVSDPPMALDEINTTHGQICSLGVGTLWRAVCDSDV